MVTLNSADSALKSFYLDAISESLNMKVNPFLAKIEHTSDYVTGKEVRKAMRIGMNGGIGAGTETGDLPTAKGNTYLQLTTTLKNLYGTIEISDKAIRASANNEGAFVNLVNEEMQTLVESAKFNFGRMLFGDGTGKIGKITDTDTPWIYVTNIQNFVVGMYVGVKEAPYEYQNRRVEEVNYEEGCIRLDLDPVNPDDIVGLYFHMYGSADNELTGLGAIFSNAELYGLERMHHGMMPIIEKDFGDFSEEKVEKVIDTIEAKTGERVDYIICSWGVRRAIKEYYRAYDIPVKYIDIDGVKAIEFLGIPVVVDRFCPEGTMYLLTSKHFKLCQLCDWQWLEAEDGKILKQVPGKPVYTATLVKYADLICENPSAQGMLTGITEV